MTGLVREGLSPRVLFLAFNANLTHCGFTMKKYYDILGDYHCSQLFLARNGEYGCKSVRMCHKSYCLRDMFISVFLSRGHLIITKTNL